MTDAPFLTVDETLALERLLADARYEARQTYRYGRVSRAADAEEAIATVQGIIDRHRALTLRERAR
jgi:hypothetical protein